MAEIKAADAMKFYSRWHAVDPKSLTAKDLEVLLKDLDASKMKSNFKVRENFQLMHRIAHATTDAEWMDFAKTGEMPPLKLTSEEMELVRGGYGLIDFIGDCITVYNAVKRLV